MDEMSREILLDYLERIATALENKKINYQCIEKKDLNKSSWGVRIYEYKKIKDVYLLTYFESQIGHNQSFAVTEEVFNKDYEVI